uniref:Gap junction protein n=1 Tax=Sus scrofa TaxID=9823 RepID=A0A8D1NDJ2_PIG
MDQPDLLGFLVITLNCNVTIVGKVWLIFMVLLRMAVLILAGSPVYQDEQERFVCNTLQPGCANVCYDIFAPVSHLRFWLIQSVAVLLPFAIFSVYVLHKGAEVAVRGPRGPDNGPEDADPLDLTSGARRCLTVPDFSSGYTAHLCLRTLTEAAFGALHYLLFGFLVPKRFSCTHPPCTGVVDCYVSRPTEKSILMLFVWAVCALSFLLSVTDLLCTQPWPGGGRLRGRRTGRGRDAGRTRARGCALAGACAAEGGGRTVRRRSLPRGGAGSCLGRTRATRCPPSATSRRWPGPERRPRGGRSAPARRAPGSRAPASPSGCEPPASGPERKRDPQKGPLAGQAWPEALMQRPANLSWITPSTENCAWCSKADGGSED